MKANLSYSRLREIIDQALPLLRRRHQTFSDGEIVLAYLWAKLERQPTYWAANAKAYPPGCRFMPPTASTLSRRLRTVPVIELLSRVRRTLADRLPALPLKVVDSCPLTVGNASGDPDARRGYGGGGRARGYKLCVLASGGLVREWSLSGMNENDQTLAAKVAPTLGRISPHGWGYVSGDNGFDGNPLHVAIARQGHVLVAPPRKANRGKRDKRRSSAERIRGLDLSDSPLRHAGVRETMGRNVMRARGQIERLLGHATALGLGHLPMWTRTPHRVALHVEAMLIFHTHRVLELHNKTSQQPIKAAG